MLTPAKAPRLRTIDELADAVGSRLETMDALEALRRDGLIRREGRRVSATRAAISFMRLEL